MTEGPASLSLALSASTRVMVAGTEDVDHQLVRRLRRRVADRLSNEIVELRTRRGTEISAADQRMLGRSLVDDEVAAWVAARAREGAESPSPAHEDALARAVFAALFGLGRLQPYVDDPHVENIDVHGCDQVWLSYADGRLVQAPPVADSDDELIEIIQAFAAYQGQSTREFSTAKPLLNLRLPDGSRLSAWMAVSPRPGMTVRRHRLSNVTLDDLLALGTIDAALRAFLGAAVAARKNIVVTGGVNAGKTTLVRALANEFDPYEKVVVAEKEYELGLDRLPDRHHQVISLEARDANAEGAGEVSLAALVLHALRMNPRHIIVGEVRGDELIPMLTAMGSGNDGSLCTLHANSAHAAFNRMAAIGLSSPQRLPVEAAHLLAADAIDFVVHLVLDNTISPTGSSTAGRVPGRRYVSTVLEVTGVGENGRVARNEVFRPGMDGRAVPGSPVACLADLVRAGFDPALLDRPQGWWDQPPPPPKHANGRASAPLQAGGVL
jgi:pilus assembly protein CpaF